MSQDDLQCKCNGSGFIDDPDIGNLICDCTFRKAGLGKMSQDVAPVWKKPEPDKVFWDGEKFLVAIMVSNNKTQTSGYEYYVIKTLCDVESPVIFFHNESDQEFDEWDWEDVDWYISINHKDVAGEE